MVWVLIFLFCPENKTFMSSKEQKRLQHTFPLCAAPPQICLG